MIYAINKRTKEHRVWHPQKGPLSIEEVVRLADADGWIKHDGRGCPLPDGVAHEVQIRDSQPQTWRWGNSGSGGDIIAYRPIFEDKEQGVSSTAVDDQFASDPNAWRGEGLPPVGCECNCWHTGSHQGAVTVRYMGSEMCVLLNHDIGEEQCGPIEAYRFEPLRTAAQRAEDEAVEEMARVMRDSHAEVTELVRPVSEFTSKARALYRAGYRKT